MEAQNPANEEQEEKPETQRSRDEEELKERTTESTIHTVPELLMDTQRVFTLVQSNMSERYKTSNSWHQFWIQHLKLIVQSFCLLHQEPLKNPEELRREMELQLEAWQRQTLGSQEEVMS